MDLGFLVFSVFVMIISPLGDVSCSAGDTINCPCTAIPPVNLTQPPAETCFQIASRFRYSCTKGYLRKAGTSNLIKCQKTADGVVKWTEPTLQCIPDPRIIPTPPPSPTVKQGHTDIPPDSTIATTVTAATTSLQMTQSISTSASVTTETDSTEPTSSGLQVLSVHTPDAIDCPCPGIPPVNLTEPLPETCFQIDSRFRYNCTKGYVRKAGTSNLIKCQNISGVANWTEATLQCIPYPKVTPTPSPSPTVKQGLADITPDSTIATTITGKVLTETKTTNGTTQASSTAVPLLRSTVEPHQQETTSTIARISIISLAIVCACAGVCFFFYKRRTNNMIPVHTSEDDVPMDDIQFGDRVCSQPATAAEISRLNGDQEWGA